jgi:homoserine trans-succinylase
MYNDEAYLHHFGTVLLFACNHVYSKLHTTGGLHYLVKYFHNLTKQDNNQTTDSLVFDVICFSKDFNRFIYFHFL